MPAETTCPPIAVVGLGVLAPGAVGVEDFWRMVLERRDLITEVPRDRWLAEDYYDPNPLVPDRSYVRRGAFLSPVEFDPLTFGIPPSILSATDTAQLLALVVARQVFDEIGLDDLDRERVGVILGASTLDLIPYTATRLQGPLLRKVLREHGLPDEDVEHLVRRVVDLVPPWGEATFPGGLTNVVAGRVANRFDVHGVNHTTDAACASSFAALASAVAELRLGRADLVVTGGVDTFNDITAFVGFSKTPALSPTQDCRPFSDRADGTMLGEALGMVALKRLDDAERAGDRVHAVIRGVGASSDGRSTSIYAPLERGQRRALRQAYAEAGYGPETVELLEAHGTATPAGDVAEFAALRAVFDATGRPDRQWCALGSVKSQIGHTKCAAGAVGLLKAVLAVRQGVLPPTIKVDRPNPELGVDGSPFHLNTECRPWVRPSDHPRRASVSSFGFGGSNFHVTLEEYRPTPGTRGRVAWRVRSAPAELVLLSAESPSEVVAAARSVDTGQPLADLARRSQQEFRGAAPVRLALVVGTDGVHTLGEAADVVERRQDSSFDTPTGWHYAVGEPRPGRLGYLFPGQGSQYVGMGADVAVHLPGCREPWDRVADLDFGVELHRRVFPPPSFSQAELDERQERLTETEWAQPALAAHCLALLGVLGEVGLRPDGAAGHSFGELVALHAAGVFDADSLARIARRRGQLMADLPDEAGVMLAVTAPADEVTDVLRAHPGVWLANHNAPDEVVVAGPRAAVGAVASDLAARGMRSVPLRTAGPFHTPMMSGAGGPLADFLAGISASPPRFEVYGGADAQPYPPAPAEIRARVVDQVTRPVRFRDVVEEMYAAGVRTFVEVGPSAVLTGLVGRVLGTREHLAVPLDRPGRCGVATLWDGLARLAVRGVPLDFTRLWSAYEPTRTTVEAKPRMTVSINGGNHGRPYPPANGSGELPPSAVPRPVPAAPAVVPAPPPTTPAPIAPPPPAPAPPAAPAGRGDTTGGFTPLPGRRSQQGWPGPDTGPGLAAASDRVAAPGPAEPAPDALAPRGTVAAYSGYSPPSTPSGGSGWLRVVGEAQRQTAQAHADFQRMMTQSHLAFLRMSESTFAALLGGGMPLQAEEPEEPGWARAAAGPPAALPAAPVEDLAELTGSSADPLGGPLPPEPAAETPIADVRPAAHAGEPGGSPGGWTVTPMPPAPWPDGAAGAPGTSTAPDGDPVASAAPPTSATPAASGVGTIDLGALGPERIEELLLSVVAETTGYPVEVLGLDMELDADLGVDSIKKVEMFSALRDRVGELPQEDVASWARLRTLREVAERLATGGDGPTALPAEPAPTRADTDAHPGRDPEPADQRAPVAPVDAVDEVDRFVVRVRGSAAPGQPTPGLGDAQMVVTDDGRGVARALVDRLVGEGFAATVVDEVPPSARAVVLLDGLTEDNSPDHAVSLHRAALAAVSGMAAAGAGEQGTLLVTVQDTGGDFGLSGRRPDRAWLGGLAGLARTAGREWPRASVRAIDCQCAERTPEEIAEALFTELTTGGGTPDVGLGVDGSRVVLQYDRAAVEVPDPAQHRVGPGSVIVVTGGARGVTAAALLALAREHQPHLALIGRTELAEEPAGLDGAAEEAELLRRLTELWSDRPEGPPAPAELSAEARRVLAVREIRTTLDALTAAGSPVRYLAVDVRDATAVTDALDEVRRDWGPITGLVHGAGTVADGLLADKTDERFASVFEPKVGGLRALLSATEDDPLELLVLFSSIAGCFGNRGQADYAMANEVLNLVASAQRVARPDCAVSSIAWGPWRGGMIGPELAHRLRRAGIPLISSDAGAAAFTREVSAAEPPHRVVITAAGTLDALGANISADDAPGR